MNKVEVGPVDWNEGEKVLGLEQFMWRKRTIACSNLLESNDLSVLDIGAGNMYLKKLLAEKVKYYPLDYTKRQEDTIVCDLNKYEFPKITVDAAVCAGILEYINDIDWFFDQLALSAKKIIITYRSKEGGYPTSLYTTYDLINKLYERGYVITKWDKEFSLDWPLLACFEKLTPNKLSKNYYCTGCGACANICPSDAINLVADTQGFFKPKINNENCINCNQCVKVCPSAKSREMSEDADDSCQCYAAWASDEIRNDSSSGGAFTVLSDYIFRNKGSVFGAGYTDEFFVEHSCASKASELTKLRHSKYVQSNTKLTFREVKQLLETEVMVLYVGTPCQIAGLKAYLGKEYESLLTIDVVCFCVTPNTAFHKYLEECYGINSITNAIFHDKYRGWTSNAYTIHKKDGTVLYLTTQNDYYQKAFHGVLCRNKTCDDCRYACFPRQGDITMGDFWGIDQHDATWNDNKGTSLLIANTKKAIEFIEKVKSGFNRIEQVPIEWCRNKGNRIGHDGRGRHRDADYFMSLIQKNKFVDSVDKVLENKHDIGIIIGNEKKYGSYMYNFAMYKYLNAIGLSVALIDICDQTKQLIVDKRQSLFAHSPFAQNDIEWKDNEEIMQACNIIMFSINPLYPINEENIIQNCIILSDMNQYKISYGLPYCKTNDDIFTKVKQILSRDLVHAIAIEEATQKEQSLQEHSLTVINPVFLCDRSFYESMAKKGKMRLPKHEYMGIYLSCLSLNKDKIIKSIGQLVEILDFRIVCEEQLICPELNETVSRGYNVLSKALVEEWLACIRYSKLFLTDSYYGICFAIIFHKNFVVLECKEDFYENSMIRSLLSTLQLENRIINSIEDISNKQFTELIDFDTIDKKLGILQHNSEQWLLEQVKFSELYNKLIVSKIELTNKYNEVVENNKNLKLELSQVSYEKDCLKNTLNQVYSSQSWKITRIWRKPIEIIRRLQKH